MNSDDNDIARLAHRAAGKLSSQQLLSPEYPSNYAPSEADTEASRRRDLWHELDDADEAYEALSKNLIQ